MVKGNRLIFLAFLTATASVINIIESLIFKALPIPFIRIGFSNIVILYLVMERKILDAVVVAVAKSLIGGIATLTLFSPVVLLSLTGGLAAVITMSLGLCFRPRLSAVGISILGATAHNLMQLVLARHLIIKSNSVFVLTSFLIFFGLINGLLSSFVYYYLMRKIPNLKANI